MGLDYMIPLFLLVVVPAAIWLASRLWQDRSARRGGRPPATDGGEATIYRRKDRPNAGNVDRDSYA